MEAYHLVPRHPKIDVSVASNRGDHLSSLRGRA